MQLLQIFKHSGHISNTGKMMQENIQELEQIRQGYLHRQQVIWQMITIGAVVPVPVITTGLRAC